LRGRGCTIGLVGNVGGCAGDVRLQVVADRGICVLLADGVASALEREWTGEGSG
jgi:hypothetical protein